MGKLLSGHYGAPPESESIPLSLKECNQKLSLKPSDFVSEGAPKFFDKDFGASGRYLLFQTDDHDLKGASAWRPGYYLLPLEAKDVLSALKKHRGGQADETRVLPIELEASPETPRDIQHQALEWGKTSQPLFFKCRCDHLELRLYPPWALRHRWKARLRCPKRCQPPMTTVL